MDNNDIEHFLENRMIDKQLIKDVLELLQLIHTSHHTVLATNPPRDPWVYHKVSRKIEDMETRLNNKLRAETEQPEQEEHAVIAGALFDFVGWLTTRKERIVLSSTDDASPAVDAIKQFAEMRGLSLDNANVQGWVRGCTANLQQPQKTNQCAETCERAKLCDGCGIALTK